MGKFILWNKIKIKLIIVALILSSVSVLSKTFERDSLPPEPEWYYYFTILGKDINQNGIRDDLESWINQNSKDVNEYRLFNKYAFQNQKYLENASNESQSKVFLKSIQMLMKCFHFLSYKKGLKHDEQLFMKRLELEKRIYNTLLRKIVRSIANVHSGGDWLTHYSVKDVVDYPKYCQFKINNLKMIIDISLKEDKRWRNISPAQYMEILKKYEDTE